MRDHGPPPSRPPHYRPFTAIPAALYIGHLAAKRKAGARYTISLGHASVERDYGPAPTGKVQVSGNIRVAATLRGSHCGCQVWAWCMADGPCWTRPCLRG